MESAVNLRHLIGLPNITGWRTPRPSATTSLERLRLATALAHTVPGATMHVVCHSGQHVNVGVHPGADLDACAMRKVVIASGRPEVRDCSELVADITVAGALQHLGGGVYRRVFDDVEQRWLATLAPAGDRRRTARSLRAGRHARRRDACVPEA